MEDLKFYSDALFNLANKVNAYFISIYIGEEPFLSYCIDKNKEKTLTEILSLLTRKAYTSEELIEGFDTEYAFAEGKGFAIFLIRIKDDVFIATIVDENPNFALLKYEHEKLSKKLIDKLEDMKALKVSKEQEKIEKEEVPSDIEQLEEALATHKETAKEEEKPSTTEEVSEKEIPSDIENLEEVLSTTEEISTKQEELEEEVPSLEEILEEGESIIAEDILDEIKKEFIKEIGPVGKILFNKHLKNLGKITKKNIKLLTNELAEEIPEEERKLKFLKEIKRIIKGGDKE